MVWYNQGKMVMLDATLEGEAPVDLVGDVVNCALMKTTYTINIDTHDHWDDVVASEAVATNYTARGHALASKAIAVDNTNDRAEFDAADLVFTAIGNGSNDTFDQIIINREQDTTPTDANTVVIAHSTVASTTTNGGNITMQWNAEGILQITA